MPQEHVQCDINCQRLWLWDDDFWQRQNMISNVVSTKFILNCSMISLRWKITGYLLNQDSVNKEKYCTIYTGLQLGPEKIFTKQGISLNMKTPDQNFTVTNQINGLMHKEVYITMNCTHKNMVTEVTSPSEFSKWLISHKAAQLRYLTSIHNHYCYIIKTTLFCTFKEASSTTLSYLNLRTLCLHVLYVYLKLNIIHEQNSTSTSTIRTNGNITT
jgi:hypothetical protein